MRLSLWTALTLANYCRRHPIFDRGPELTVQICERKVICLKLARQKSNSRPKGHIRLYQLPLREELYFFGARWTTLGLTFLCFETKLERNPPLIDVCSNCLAKYLVRTHFQNTWTQSVRNRRDSASFETTFLSLSVQAICLIKDLYLLTKGEEN